MGQLTNLYVSESYQGLLKMTNSTTGVTGTLQTVQTGDGTNTPLQISQTQVNISGSLTINGSPITGSNVDTGSFVTTSSFNAYTSSVNTKLAGLDIETGSLQNQINGLATTGSLSGYTTTTVFNNYTGSNDAKVNDLISKTGSYATITGQTALSSSIASTDLSQNNRLTALESVTGSINRNGLITTGSIGATQSITGSLGISGTLTALSASITYLETVYETASIIYSSGSNQFGDASDDTQTLWGTVNLPSGPLVVTGSVTSTGGFIGNLTGTASFATSASYTVSSSFATNAATASIANDLIVVGKNNNPSTLTRGTIVRIVGANGDNPLFDSASWTDDANSANTLGMLSEDVASNGFANIVVQGKVLGINTNGMTAGDLLYLSSSGQYTTSSVPAPYHEVRLGQVLRSNVNQGSAYISVDNGYELSELHDVDITNPVNGDLLVYRSGSYGQWVNETGGELGYATTGSNTFIGNQSISGSVDISGSLTAKGLTFASLDYNNLNGQIQMNATGSSGKIVLKSENVSISSSVATTITGSVDIRGGNLDLFSNNTTVNTDLYLTNSLVGQSNMFFGWGDNPGGGGALATQANYTGSLRITGSNNIINLPQVRGTLFQSTWSGYGGYISGSNNWINGNNSGIYMATGSQLFPKTQGNVLGFSSAIGLSFTTSSLSSPIIQQNTLYGGQINIVHNSGSVTVAANLLNTGQISSTQAFATNVVPAISANMMLGGTIVLNHVSSSINVNQNFVSTPLTVNNHLSSSNITNNVLALNNNMWLGGSNATGPSVWVSGSQSSNAARLISDNLIGGRSNIISSSFVSSSNSNLLSSLIFGQNLIVSGNHASTGGGSAFLGRFNDTTSLHLAQDIVFAVGTGTAAGSRRTGLYVTSGSLVGVSGSLQVQGTSTFTGSLQIFGTNTSNPENTLLINSGSIKMYDPSGSVRISNQTNQAIVYWNADRRVGFFVGQSNMDQVNTAFGITSDSTDNYTFGGNFNNFRSGSNNLMLGVGNMSLKSGSNNVILARQTSYTTGSNNLILGSAPSGIDEVQDYFNLQLPSNNVPIMFKSGSAPLTISGSLLITNSATITGSVQGNVLPLTVTSNTASLNLNNGNFFELALTGSSDIRIEPSNIKPGQTINIKLNTTGSGTVSFPTSVKQPSGSAYVPTTAVGTDIITMLSFDSTNLYVANVKNLI